VSGDRQHAGDDRAPHGVRTPTLTFLGANGTVTGSRHLVEHGTTRVLVDAGLYQGLKELRQRNWSNFPIDPAIVSAVVLSHAHLDHCGYLPRLVSEGFSGPVLCTPETGELAAIVLRDSAHLQQEDAAYANAAGFSRHTPALPLYDAGDVEKSLELLRPVPLHEQVTVTDDLTVTLRSAGHILGSATVLVESAGTRTLFSGDLGRPTHPFVPLREDPPEADVVVLESTYGDRTHPQPDDTLAEAIRRTVDRGGTVLVPAFAIDRTELVLLEIGRLMAQGLVPEVPVHVDSPMALAALRVYAGAIERAGVKKGFGIPELHAASTPQASEQLNRPRHPCIVVSASGMATGGRVVHHLKHQLPDPRNTVVLTGYQAVGTRGRALADGARDVKIHGRYVRVRAEVVLVDQFSVHADAPELVAWLQHIPRPPRNVYVVHGEAKASSALAERIEEELGWSAVVPRYRERVLLG
jgi:metallo-beta-lactamase family protein